MTDSGDTEPSGPSEQRRHRYASSRFVVAAYVSVGGLFTLSTSLIWAINTIFLIRVGGLDIFQAMLVNTVYTLAQLVCEVPTGVIADTIGRRASLLLSVATLMVSTVLYVISPRMGWGIWGFFAASTVIGLGYTFQSGAMDAWLVDALDSCGYARPKERVFAAGSNRAPSAPGPSERRRDASSQRERRMAGGVRSSARCCSSRP
ncbi:MAG: MFS transporter [Actinobacteria bacterium]|nr:MAG: MFS transporter [Actinomycetota bacterium]